MHAPAYDLPDPVSRYLRFALRGQPRSIRSARVTHAGKLQACAGMWNAFTSVEYISMRPRGFVCDARIAVTPLVSVQVRDCYLRGIGTMRASAVTVRAALERADSPELGEAALQRWLGDAVWFPSVLRPSWGVRWNGMDERSARASITDHGIEASLVFDFGASGEIIGCRGHRYRDLSGGPVLTPWELRADGYAGIEGLMIPTWGEATWLGQDGRAPYWRGRVVTADYDFE